LKYRITASYSQEDGRLAIFSASCLVIEVMRSSTRINVDDNIPIRYGTDLWAVERQFEEMERQDAEGKGWESPAPDTAPRSLRWWPGADQFVKRTKTAKPPAG